MMPLSSSRHDELAWRKDLNENKKAPGSFLHQMYRESPIDIVFYTGHIKSERALFIWQQVCCSTKYPDEPDLISLLAMKHAWNKFHGKRNTSSKHDCTMLLLECLCFWEKKVKHLLFDVVYCP
jgi:hypothetical protein